jgi:hypothetical protein
VLDLALREQLRLVQEDPYGLLERLQLIDKQGRPTLFDDPFEEQLLIMDDFMSPHVETAIELKGRQMGVTTGALADEYNYLYRTPDPIKTLYVGDVDDTTDSSFLKIQRFDEGLPKFLQRKKSRSNRREFIFEDTGAGMRCMTAGGRSKGKGYTYQRVIFDELAFWPDDDNAYGSFTSTLAVGPHLKKKIISTPNGPGNLFHRMCMSAHRAMQNYETMEQYLKESPVRFRFTPWFIHRGYRREPPKSWEPSSEEAYLAGLYNLDVLQLYWRHWRIYGDDGIGIDAFRKQYPSTVLEGFLASGGAWFDVEYLNEQLASVQHHTGNLVVYEKPEPGMTYAMGIDPSWANGGDYFAVQVLSHDGRQVCRFSTNQGGEESAAKEAAAIASFYNDARVLTEGNPGGAGRVVIKILRRLGCKLWWRPPKQGKKPSKTKRPWTTHRGSKEEVFAHARLAVNGDALLLNDYLTIEEMTNVREDPVSGRIEASVGHDDHVMALALAEWNRRSLPRAKPDLSGLGRKPRSRLLKRSPLVALARAEGLMRF